MSSVGIDFSLKLALTKEQFTLITKALVGKLRPEEIEAAQQLGLDLMQDYASNLAVKADAAKHALAKAAE